MERDDLIVNDSYAMAAHHSEEAGAAIRKKIWLVTALLTLRHACPAVQRSVSCAPLIDSRPQAWIHSRHSSFAQSRDTK